MKNYDLSSAYFLMVGAAPLSADLTEQLVRILPHAPFIGQGYGADPPEPSSLIILADLRQV